MPDRSELERKKNELNDKIWQLRAKIQRTEDVGELRRMQSEMRSLLRQLNDIQRRLL